MENTPTTEGTAHKQHDHKAAGSAVVPMDLISRITVQLFGNEPSIVFDHVQRSITEGDLKSMIEEHTGIPVSDQVLRYKSYEFLDNTRRLETHIFLLSSFTLRLYQKKGISITVTVKGDVDPKALDKGDQITDSKEGNDGFCFHLDVHTSDTVERLKNRIQYKTGTLKKTLVLSFGGKKLSRDDRALEDYKVRNQSDIIAIVWPYEPKAEKFSKMEEGFYTYLGSPAFLTDGKN